MHLCFYFVKIGLFDLPRKIEKIDLFLENRIEADRSFAGKVGVSTGLSHIKMCSNFCLEFFFLFFFAKKKKKKIVFFDL